MECDGRDGVEVRSCIAGRETVSNRTRRRHGADSVFAQAFAASTRQPQSDRRRRARTAKSCGP